LVILSLHVIIVIGDKELRKKVGSLEKIVQRLRVARVEEDEEGMGEEINFVLRVEVDVMYGRTRMVWRRQRKKQEVKAKRRVLWDFKAEWWRRKRDIIRSLRRLVINVFFNAKIKNKNDKGLRHAKRTIFFKISIHFRCIRVGGRSWEYLGLPN